MFDYQAGEKYKLTLIMVGIAGLLMGIFISLLLMPSDEPRQHRQQVAKRLATDPDLTGYRTSPSSQAAAASNESAPMTCDPMQARMLVENWLPLAWDLSAYSARASQEKAISYMTPECAEAYRQNIWTSTVASQIEQSGVQSSFTPTSIQVGNLQSDGSIIIGVRGKQTLAVADKGGKDRDVNVEYLIKPFPDGLRIAGISEVGEK